jgi:peptide/nickel transport system permease protein
MSQAVLDRGTAQARIAARLVAPLDFLRLLASRPLGLVGFIGVIVFLLVAYIGPLLVPLSTIVDVTAIFDPPSAEHPLGTDNQGRDVLNQVINGGRDIFNVAFLAAALSTLLAISLGAFAAVAGGRIDAAVLLAADIFLTIPTLPLLLVVASLLKINDPISLAVLIATLGWASLLRQVRAQVLSLKERDYVEAARSLDLGNRHIIFSEILPNMRNYLAIHFILATTGAVYAQAALILLGIVPLSGHNWGVMLNLAWSRGALFFRDSLWYILSPVLAIALFQLCLVWFASSLEEIFNPRLRGIS